MALSISNVVSAQKVAVSTKSERRWAAQSKENPGDPNGKKKSLSFLVSGGSALPGSLAASALPGSLAASTMHGSLAAASYVNAEEMIRRGTKVQPSRGKTYSSDSG